jgi:hypothetical protein
MKAETKAKRRVTLSIVGLGMLDESELETIPQLKTEQLKALQPGNNSPPEEEPLPLLIQIKRFAFDKKISNDEMREIMKRVTGSEKKSIELNDGELTALLKYLELKFS